MMGQLDRPPRLAPDADDARFIRRVAILLVMTGVLAALYLAIDLIILAFGSVLGAITIRAIGDQFASSRMGRLRLSPRSALLAAIVTVLATLGFLGWLIIVQFGTQVNELVAQLPGLLREFAAWASRSPVGAKIVDASEAAFAGSRVARDIGGLLRGSGELLLNMILLLIGALFMAADPEIYRRGALLLVPRSIRPAVADTLDDIAQQLRLWLQAELILMTTMGLLIGIGLTLSHVPSAAALGLLSGLSEFIPYVGPTVAMLPALGFGATVGNGPLIGALVTFAVVRLIQTNFITPYVQARIVSIPPAVTVFAIIGIGMIFGLFGLFFSAALLVVIFTVVRSLYLREVLGEDFDRNQAGAASLPAPPAPRSPAAAQARLVD